MTFSSCLGVGNLTLASMKMSNSPGSAPGLTLGLNIDRPMHEIYKAFQDRLTFLCRHNDNLDWLGFLDKSNLLKIPDCRSFTVLKTLTSSRPEKSSKCHKTCFRFLSPV